MFENKFKIQDDQYEFPYHHLIHFDDFNLTKSLNWGWEYYAYVTKVLNILEKINPKKILDFGCGEGKVSIEISKKFPQAVVKGVDLSEKAVLFAKAFSFGLNKNLDFSNTDITQENGKFDVVVAVEVFEHIPDENIKETFFNIKRVLSDNGYLIISVPSSNYPVQKKHYRHYDIATIVSQAEGFSLEKCFFVVNGGLFYNLANRLFGKLSSFALLRKILFSLSKKYLFEAKESNAKHLVVCLKKK